MIVHITSVTFHTMKHERISLENLVGNELRIALLKNRAHMEFSNGPQRLKEECVRNDNDWKVRARQVLQSANETLPNGEQYINDLQNQLSEKKAPSTDFNIHNINQRFVNYLNGENPT